MKALRLVALAVALTFAVPLASASSLPDALACEGNAVQRAVCAANETIDNVLTAADPVIGFAGQEVAWAADTTCDIAEHFVGPTCRAIAESLAADMTLDPVVLA